MKQIDVDQLLARAQVGIAFLFSAGFFGVLFLLMLYHKEMGTTEVTILTGLVSVLGTLLALMMNFFFSRARPAALPDPTTTSSTTTTTTGPSPIIVPPGATVATVPVIPHGAPNAPISLNTDKPAAV